MSKVGDLQALREARYAAHQAQTVPGTAAVKRAAPTPAQPPAPVVAIESEDLCGHRGMGNKSCQRSAGHAEKSHRYR
jgi:hypothetical protein